MKKYVIGIAAVVLALAGTAFAPHKAAHTVKNPGKSGPYYYLYNLSTSAGKNTASNYSFISPQPSNPDDVSGCPGGTIPCVIFATGSSGAGGMPDATAVNTTNLPGNTETLKVAH